MPVHHFPISDMNSSTSSLSGDLSLFLLLPLISRPIFPPPTFSSLRLRLRLRRLPPILAADLRTPAAFPTKNSRQNQLNQEYEDDDDEDDDNDGEEESVAAEEYEYEAVVSEEEEDDEEEESGTQVERERVEVKEEGMRRRVERVVNLVKELGEDFLDFEELAIIYDFPVDKFQV